MEVRVHLYTQSEPVVMTDVRNAYQKGDLYRVMLNDGKRKLKIQSEKFPSVADPPSVEKVTEN